jgi:hypothetical protein
LLLVGEPFWVGNPPDAAYEWITDGDRTVFTTLAGMLERFEAAGFELIEMVLAEPHGWDRYEASQWQTVSDWLRTNPTNPAAPALRAWIDRNRQTYLHYGRAFFNWGVFVLRQRA